MAGLGAQQPAAPTAPSSRAGEASSCWDRWSRAAGSRAGSTRPQLLQPNATSPINKTGSSPLAARGGWTAWRRPGPSLSCPLSPAEAQQRRRETTAPGGRGEQHPGAMGAKLNGRAPARPWEKGRRKESLCFSQCMAGQEGWRGREGEMEMHLCNVCIL